MTGILGRMAAESGKMITWDEAMASKLELAPGLENCTMDSPAPVMPDKDGHTPSPCRGSPRCCKRTRRTTDTHLNPPHAVRGRFCRDAG